MFFETYSSLLTIKIAINSTYICNFSGARQKMKEISYSSTHLFCKCTLDFHLLVPSRLNCLYMDCKAAHRDWSAGGRSHQYKMEDKCIQTAPASQIQNMWLHSSMVQIHIHLYLHCSLALSTLLYMCIWRGKNQKMNVDKAE